jgi:hypothetical protein
MHPVRVAIIVSFLLPVTSNSFPAELSPWAYLQGTDRPAAN